MNRLRFLLIFALLFSSASAREMPSIPEMDRVRLAEAFRLSESLGDQIWKGWNDAPFSVLLVTPEHEFLIRHPEPSADFQSIGYDSLLQSEVFTRPRKMDPHFLATFPVVGSTPTIVIGQAENTNAKSSTPWVITLLHEHFHQLQMSQSDYFSAVDALDLSGGDQTGMWMLNFPFPYDSSKNKKQFQELSTLLLQALSSNDRKLMKSYFAARAKWTSQLKTPDYRYLSFQVWQEGIARYTEYKVTEWAAQNAKPSPAFSALSDSQSYKNLADQQRQDFLQELKTLDLEKDQRIVFYAFGAAEGFLLDRINPNWRDLYFSEKFFVERYNKQ